MEVTVPLHPDPQKRELRRIRAQLPDDTTQEEFWQFVVMTGNILFGNALDPPEEGQFRTTWNPRASLDENFKVA